MMDRFLRLASIGLIAAGFAACDDETSTPQGDPSTVNVAVYIENDGENGLTAGDDPIAGATVTLTPTGGGTALTAQSGANGMATFADVPAGIYTMTHTPGTPITDAVLTGAAEQTVVAQFEGGTTNASIIYAYLPGSISGVFFRDEDTNGEYDAEIDTTLAGFEAVLVMGADTADLDARFDSVTVGDDGVFEFTTLPPGSYTILVRPLLGTEVTDTTVAVTVTPGDETEVFIAFTGGEAVTDIADARELANGTTVTVEGVVTAGSGVYSSTNIYIQDETGGILLFTGSGGPFINLAVGDSVRVTGTIGAFNQEIQLGGGPAMEIEVLGTGTVPDPRTVTATEVLAGDFQGELVVATGLTIDSVGPYFSGTNFNTFVTQGADTFIVFFDGDVGIDRLTILEGETYNITGIMTRFNADFEIKPRSQADVELTSNPGGTLPIGVARSMPDGETVTVTGVVTASTASYSATQIYVQDATGGIALFTGSGGPDVTGLVVGDSVEVTGELGTFSAERQIAGGAALTVTDVGDGTVPTPQDVDAADINAAKFQGELVIADSVEVLSVSVSGSGNVTVVVADNAGEYVIFADVTAGFVGTDFTVGESYEITGIAASFQSGSNPPQYQIKPRGIADVVGL